MSKIDANVAVQIADTIRPAQVSQDRNLQAQQALVAQSQSITAPVSSDDLRAAAAQIKQVVEAASSRRLGFAVHEESGDLVVKVTDSETGKMVKQIPGEEVLRMRDRLHDMIGMFIDEHA
jgi:flagellar protein FlaG